MRKWLTIVALIVFLISTSNVFADIDGKINARIAYVSNNYNSPNPGKGTIQFDVYAWSTSGSPNIDFYLEAVQMNSLLSLNYQTSSFTSHHFSETNYTFWKGRSILDESILGWQFDFNTGETHQTIGTDEVKILSVWITYTMTTGNATISYCESYGATDFWTVLNDGSTDITGDHDTMPTELQDFSLPVQMASFDAEYNSESGVTLQWETASEMDCAGFHVWRSESSQGDFTKLTTALIPGHGNTSAPQEYTYVDPNVQPDTPYWYQLEEVTYKYGESGKTFNGPIRVDVPALPTSLALHQNYPNPFNPLTSMDYEVPKTEAVVLKVYNLLGHEIRTLVDGIKAAGRYTIAWDGNDDQGRSVSSGIYFYRLMSGSEVKIRKMVKVE